MQSPISELFENLPEELRRNIPEEKLAKIKGTTLLQASFFEAYRTFVDLHRDVMISAGYLKSDHKNEAYWRRVCFRVTFAWFEGTIFALKRAAFLTQDSFFGYEFTRGEQAFLLEERYVADSKGKDIKVSNRWFESTDVNLRLTFNLLAKGFGVPYELDAAGSGWQSLKKAIKVRNRVTHPKRNEELAVTADEIGDLTHATVFFSEQFQALFQQINPKVNNLRKTSQVENTQELDAQTDAAAEVLNQLLNVHQLKELFRQAGMLAKNENLDSETRAQITQWITGLESFVARAIVPGFNSEE